MRGALIFHLLERALYIDFGSDETINVLWHFCEKNVLFGYELRNKTDNSICDFQVLARRSLYLL